MTLDLANFTPWSSLAGGVLLGVAAALLILFNGRVLGISGILGGVLNPTRGDVGWRVAVLAGMFVSPLVYRALAPEGFISAPRIDAGFGLIVIAGLLVGIGTRYGAGCTSGHGVCGLSRLAPRSLVATLAFMATGFATVFVIRHLI